MLHGLQDLLLFEINIYVKNPFKNKDTVEETSKQPKQPYQFISDIKETFTEKKAYRSRWVWYHTILAGELFLIIILLIAILTKI